MKVSKIIATGLGTGYAPVGPGTAGSLLGIVILFFLNQLLAMFGIPKTGIFLLNLLLIIIISFLGNYSIKNIHKIWQHDDNKIVIDEIAGVWISALFLPLKWEYYLLALIIFRLYDIFKPLGIKKFDKMKTNWSVMLDDILAGIYAMITMQILIVLIDKF